MALDPNIPLSVQTPDIGRATTAFNNALMSVGRIQELKTAREQAPLRNQLLEQQVTSGQQKIDQQAQLQQVGVLGQLGSEVSSALQNNDPTSATRSLLRFRATLDPNDTLSLNAVDEDLADVQNNPQKLIQDGQQAIVEAQRVGVFKQPAKATSEKGRFTQKDGTVLDTATGETTQLPVSGAQSPQELVKGLPEDVKAKGIEAFQLAGGGKDGVKALNAAVKIGRADTQLAEVPQILDNSFPNASPAERAQLEAAVQAGKTVESGLKQAEKVRTEQRRLKKAKGFQERAVSLLDNILSSDQLGDVTGSIEGATSFRLSDVEAELIADIDEAQNILTAENMDLMTGVLSESDIKLLKNLSSGALNRRRGEKRFKKDAQQLRDKLASELVQTVDDQPKRVAPEAKARLEQLRAKLRSGQ